MAFVFILWGYYRLWNQRFHTSGVYHSQVVYQAKSTMTGILVAGTGVGALIGPPIAEYLIKAYDWRSAYMIVGVAVLVIIIPLAQLLKRDPSQVMQMTRPVKMKAHNKS